MSMRFRKNIPGHFAKFLRQFMKEASLTQDEASKITRVCQPYLSDLVRSKRAPKPSTVKTIADSLHMTEEQRSRAMQAAAVDWGYEFKIH